jgi:SAM-dependent methyltransferase
MNIAHKANETGRKLKILIQPETQTILQQYTTSYTRTLEVGCGPGQYRLVVQGRYIGLDLTAAPYNKEFPRSIDVVADANNLPFAYNAFDLVFFSNTFYYFPDALNILAQVSCLLNSSGLLLIFDYCKPTLERLQQVYRYQATGYNAHIRTCAQWCSLLQENGFTKVEVFLNSQSWRNKLFRKLLPSRFYYYLVDNREGGIVIIGKKTKLG